MTNAKLKIPRKDVLNIRLVISQALEDMRRGKDGTYARTNPSTGKLVVDSDRVARAKAGIAELSRLLETYAR
jgi:hypothetical protein